MIGLHRLLASLEEAATEFEFANAPDGRVENFIVGIYVEIPVEPLSYDHIRNKVYEWDGESLAEREDAHGVLLDFNPRDDPNGVDSNGVPNGNDWPPC